MVADINSGVIFSVLPLSAVLIAIALSNTEHVSFLSSIKFL